MYEYIQYKYIANDNYHISSAFQNFLNSNFCMNFVESAIIFHNHEIDSYLAKI